MTNSFAAALMDSTAGHRATADLVADPSPGSLSPEAAMEALRRLEVCVASTYQRRLERGGTTSVCPHEEWREDTKALAVLRGMVEERDTLKAEHDTEIEIWRGVTDTLENAEKKALRERDALKADVEGLENNIKALCDERASLQNDLIMQAKRAEKAEAEVKNLRGEAKSLRGHLEVSLNAEEKAKKAEHDRIYHPKNQVDEGVYYDMDGGVCDYCLKPGGLIYADDGKLYHEFCIARLSEFGALKAEVEHYASLIADLTRDMNEEYDLRKKAEAELERVRPLIEAAIGMVPGERGMSDLIHAALAYCAGKEK